MKGKVTRFTDTVAYIQGYVAGGLPQGVRNDIATLINTRYPRLSAQDRQTYNALSEEMSVKDQIAVGVAKGSKDERAQRRAITLLWGVLAVTQGFPGALNARKATGMSLGTGALAAALQDVMMKAAVVASSAGAAHVFNTHLSFHTRQFLRVHRVFIAGSTSGADKFSTAPTGNYSNVVNFCFLYNAEHDRFEFSTVAMAMHGGSHSFAAVSVPALHWSDVPGRGNVASPNVAPAPGFQGMLGVQLSGATWMVTTQFTGCSFCYQAAGAHPYAAHISPAGVSPKPAMTGSVLAQQLMGQVAMVAPGRFANVAAGGPFNVFGNGAGNAQVLSGAAHYPAKVPGGGAGQMAWMSILGRMSGGTWKIYTQSVDGVRAIMEARRIF